MLQDMRERLRQRCITFFNNIFKKELRGRQKKIEKKIWSPHFDPKKIIVKNSLPLTTQRFLVPPQKDPDPPPGKQ